jgi:hypothetical protein
MTQKDQVFIANVVVIDLTQETMVLNVIDQPIGVAAKLNAVVKIYNYRRFHEGYHFILMAMEIYSTLGHYMDRFIKECPCLFHDR